MSHQVCIAISGPQGGVQGHHVCALGQGQGPPARISTVKMVPQVLQKVAQSQGVQMILITPLQETASSIPGTSGPVPRRLQFAYFQVALGQSGQGSIVAVRLRLYLGYL